VGEGVRNRSRVGGAWPLANGPGRSSLGGEKPSGVPPLPTRGGPPGADAAPDHPSREQPGFVADSVEAGAVVRPQTPVPRDAGPHGQGPGGHSAPGEGSTPAARRRRRRQARGRESQEDEGRQEEAADRHPVRTLDGHGHQPARRRRQVAAVDRSAQHAAEEAAHRHQRTPGLDEVELQIEEAGRRLGGLGPVGVG